jgi:hypothetical protein
MKRPFFRPTIRALVAILALSLAGCAARTKTVTNLPIGVTQAQVIQWDSAVAELHKVAATVSTLRQAIIGLNGATYVNPQGQTEKILADGPVYATLLRSVAKIDQLEADAAAFLRKVPNTWAEPTQAKVRDYVNAIATEVQTMTQQGLLGIKTNTAQGQVAVLLNNLTASANLILALAQ